MPYIAIVWLNFKSYYLLITTIVFHTFISQSHKTSQISASKGRHKKDISWWFQAHIIAAICVVKNRMVNDIVYQSLLVFYTNNEHSQKTSHQCDFQISAPHKEKRKREISSQLKILSAHHFMPFMTNFSQESECEW